MDDKVTTVTCWICGKPVPLAESKTDDHGRIVHENCYAAVTLATDSKTHDPPVRWQWSLSGRLFCLFVLEIWRSDLSLNQVQPCLQILDTRAAQDRRPVHRDLAFGHGKILPRSCCSAYRQNGHFRPSQRCYRPVPNSLLGLSAWTSFHHADPSYLHKHSGYKR